MRQPGRPIAEHHDSGTLSLSSRSQTSASASVGARQSLRGDSDPPEPTDPNSVSMRISWLYLATRSDRAIIWFSLMRLAFPIPRATYVIAIANQPRHILGTRQQAPFMIFREPV
jgi:hypothetical protein